MVGCYFLLLGVCLIIPSCIRRVIDCLSISCSRHPACFCRARSRRAPQNELTPRPPSLPPSLPCCIRLGKHGSSFSTFYRRVKSKSPTILIIRTTENEVCLRECVCVRVWRERERRVEALECVRELCWMHAQPSYLFNCQKFISGPSPHSLPPSLPPSFMSSVVLPPTPGLFIHTTAVGPIILTTASARIFCSSSIHSVEAWTVSLTLTPPSLPPSLPPSGVWWLHYYPMGDSHHGGRSYLLRHRRKLSV